MFGPALIRPGRDDDADRIIALIERCWSDYPGVVLYVQAEAPELLALASYYRDAGGALWVTQDVSGMVATRPLDDGAWEICRVYVHPGQHGRGLGMQLMDVAESHARTRGATRLELWTDTRFARAHRFYEKRGYVRGERRALHDLCGSEEWHYARAALTPGDAAPR